MDIDIRNLKKKYDNQTVLDIENLSLPGGVITAIIGPNGAGKSTLLKLIGNLIGREAGEILYDGKAGSPTKDMTMVFQEPCLLRRTIRENISYPLKIRKVPKIQIAKRVETLVKDLNLIHLLDKRAGETSLGEAQKVALARALSFEPKLLLLDEPCASIDLQTTAEIERMLKKINREQKTTILIVTHNLGQARRLSDYVVMLDHGRAVESGENSEFFKHPKMPETRQLIEREVLI